MKITSIEPQKEVPCIKDIPTHEHLFNISWTMKKIIAVCMLLFIISMAKGQDINEDLYQSILENNKEKVLQLLEDGADPNYVKQLDSLRTVNMLTVAVNNGNMSIVKCLMFYEGDINRKDGINSTPLLYAASNGNKEMVRFLLDMGANVEVKDNMGNTALSLAKESGNEEVIKIIWAKLFVER